MLEITTEACESGWTGRSRKAMCPQGHREFESHLLRQVGKWRVWLAPSAGSPAGFWGNFKPVFTFNKAKNGLFLKELNNFAIIVL